MKEKYTGRWLVAEEDNAVHVIPETDVLPHSTQTEGDKREIADIHCPCKPRIATGDKDGLYLKPEVIHNSFQDAQFLDEFLKEKSQP